MSQPEYDFVDHARLMDDLKADDQRAVAYAYRKVFGGALGRLVLTHQLADAGVGQWREPKMGALERAHYDGEAAHALRMLDHAGFGSLSAAHLIAANSLEGQDHDGRNGNDGDELDRSDYGGPDDRPGEFGD